MSVPNAHVPKTVANKSSKGKDGVVVVPSDSRSEKVIPQRCELLGRD